MDYTTEQIEKLGQAVAEIVKERLNDEQAGGIASIETEMRAVLRQIGGMALGAYLSGQSAKANERMAEAGDQALKYQGERKAVVISVFGRVEYQRGYYAGGGKGKAPLDEQLGLKPGGVSAGLAELLALTGIELAFEQSQDFLAKYLLFSVSENTIRMATEKRGAQRQQQEAGWIEEAQTETWLQQRLGQAQQAPKRLYGSIDAAKVRIEPRGPEAKQPVEEDWRDLKVGCWYELERVPSAQRSRRQREKFDRDQQVFRAKNLRYYCDIEEAKRFGKRVWATGCRAMADFAPELIFVCDGAVWIWNLVSHYYPKAVQIVDWYHATEHLETIAKRAFSKPNERELWLEVMKEALWNGQVQQVIATCQALAQQHPDVLDEIPYFAHNEARMDYARFRSLGYAIGSGTIESACKQIVVQRLRKSGAQWTLDGAVRTAKARAAWLSREWDSLPLVV